MLQARGLGYVCNLFSVFWRLDGYYSMHTPQPDSKVQITVTLHRGHRPTFRASLCSKHRPATTRQGTIMQIISPLAPRLVATRIRIQGIMLWLR
ncbi:DUF1365 family protein [Mycobacterium haemophilum]|uniref:DUF1365 family protein n=1 Tax=Mycobacterium haemophilum TaxID=29311 RepID=UPI00214F54E8|nr:DUF1365 family protein [Mycobacterium haemophilum]